MSVAFQPRDITVKKILFYATRNSEPVDIREYLVSMEIIEDINSPFVYGSMHVTDTGAFASSTPITGGEIISVEYVTPYLNDDESVWGVFVIDKIRSRSVEPVLTTFIIDFMSEYGYADMTKKICRKFSGNPAKLVKGILEKDLDIQYEPFLFVDGEPVQTDDEIPVIEPVTYISNINESPFEVIKKIASLTQDTKQPTNAGPMTGYYFYETMRKGFEFRSYRSLLQNDGDGAYETPEDGNIPWDRVFYYDQNPARTDGVKDIRAMMQQITKMEIITQFDLGSRLLSGMLAKNVHQFDVTSKSFKKHSYNYFDTFESDSHKALNQHPINTTISDLNARTTHVNTFDKAYNKDSIDSGTVEEAKSRQITSVFGTNTLHIEIHGRTSLDLGEKIWIYVSNSVGADLATGVSSNDPLLTGWYIITNIKHSINSASHIMYLNVVTDSYNREP